ncbi:hypothetical protein DdX_20737 [Ditylenchus destructor]|uniref:Uncharacterized protein n=1 Tax=Ditylenchus destructor TaxID=166010 RepID=A0AAD4QVW4_9BILA|nr:hypothetical protein DdX_20737 [Ditylenchus destructor]
MYPVSLACLFPYFLGLYKRKTCARQTNRSPYPVAAELRSLFYVCFMNLQDNVVMPLQDKLSLQNKWVQGLRLCIQAPSDTKFGPNRSP